MKRSLTCFTMLMCGLLIGSGGSGGSAARSKAPDAPHVFWASDPVQPNDTVLVTGADLADVASVSIGRLKDAASNAPGAERAPVVDGWRQVAPQQVNAQSVKFVLPADIRPGIFACVLKTATAQSRQFLVNLPDVWWVQADQGDAAAPGGWIRVFGKALRFDSKSRAVLKAANGRITALKDNPSDGYCLRFSVPQTIEAGKYALYIHNEFGGEQTWVRAGDLDVKAPTLWPTQVFNVMDFYGPNADKEIERTLDKGSPTIDRTEAIQAALKKAAANGGGIVYFPAGKYAVQTEIHVPPHTLLRGAGMGLVAIRWGKGGFALDGGSDARRLENEDKDLPQQLISGSDYGIEDLSLYFPREYQTGIDGGAGFHMTHVRIRVDRYWIRNGQREDGLTLRLGDNSKVADCDILAKGVAFSCFSGRNVIVAHNKVMAGKSHISLDHADHMIVEDNDFISLDPTAYINLAGEGRNIYYAHNRHESMFVQQSDFSWTFDGVGMAYLGKIASTGKNVTLAKDPTYPNWASENSGFWKHSVVCILDGHGAGQYRFVTANNGKNWEIDRPFDVAPDDTSTVSIIPFRGRVLLIGNHFEDSGWVNAGYGSSFDVVAANNSLYRVGLFLNLGLRNDDGVHASWYIQYLDNDIYEGQTVIQTTADTRAANLYPGPTTRAAIHRRHHVHADNSGKISIGGNVVDAIVEHCDLANPRSKLDIGQDTKYVLVRENRTANGALPDR